MRLKRYHRKDHSKLLVDRVDEAQMRLKQWMTPPSLINQRVDRVDEAQMRLKQTNTALPYAGLPGG